MKLSLIGRKSIGIALLQGLDYVFPLLVAPLCIRAYGLESFGLLAFAMSISAYVGIFVDWGFGLTAVRDMSGKESKECKRILQEVTTARLIILFLMLALVATVLHIVPALTYFAASLPVIGILSATFALNLMWYLNSQGGLKNSTYVLGIARAIQLITTVTLIDSGLALVSFSAVIFLPMLLANITILLMQCRRAPSWIDRRLVLSAVARMASSRSGTLIAVGSGLYRSSNPLIVASICSPADLGGYALIEKVVKALQDLARPFLIALFPFVSRLAISEANHFHRLIYRSCVMALMAFIPIVALVMIFANPTLALLGGSAALNYRSLLTLMAITPLFGVLNNLLGPQYFTSIGKERSLVMPVVFIGLISITASTVGCIYFGVIGAAVAFCFAEFGLLCILGYMHLRLYSYRHRS